ncbi:hypothetical protein [Nostoc sp.]|uniref:hypothetical protein n=1 Tax=Nostoc sp. TaxID=1180 RepID=UPI002FFC7D3A
MGFGEAARSSPYSPSQDRRRCSRLGILRQALASPLVSGEPLRLWWFQELSKWRETMPPIAQTESSYSYSELATPWPGRKRLGVFTPVAT